jgi:rare lipoprotein A
MVRKTVIVVLLTLGLWGCATPHVESPEPLRPEEGCLFLKRGLASWYGYEMSKGKKNGKHIFNPTASGEKFVPEAMTAAHPSLPFGTMVRVVLDKPNADPNGIVVRINDRGPFVHGRIIDLSQGAAKKLGMPNTQPVILYRCS